MKAFASWSGGKDIMLAIHRFNNSKDNSVAFLVNMCNSEGETSRSHGLKTHLIQKQAISLGIELLQVKTSRKAYREKLIATILHLKTKGVEAGVFGDIFLEEHKVWIEEVCRETGITCVFPLWGDSTTNLLSEIIQEGFKTILVAVNTSKLNQNWLGRTIDQSFYDDILNENGIDPCAEFGEYHSFVYDGPNFKEPISITPGKKYNDDTYAFLELL